MPRINAVERHQKAEELRKRHRCSLYHLDDLEREVCGADTCQSKERVQVLDEEGRVVGSNNGAHLKRRNGKQAKITPVPSVPEEAQRICTDEADEQGAVGQAFRNPAYGYVMIDCQAVRAGSEDSRAKTIVCKSPNWIQYHVPLDPQRRVVFICTVPVDVGPRLVWVVFESNAPKSRVESGLVDVDGHSEYIVRVVQSLQVRVDLVDGEDKVCSIDGEEYVSTVLDEGQRARLRLGVASTDEDAVEDSLCPSCRLCRVGC